MRVSQKPHCGGGAAVTAARTIFASADYGFATTCGFSPKPQNNHALAQNRHHVKGDPRELHHSSRTTNKYTRTLRASLNRNHLLKLCAPTRPSTLDTNPCSRNPAAGRRRRGAMQRGQLRGVRNPRPRQPGRGKLLLEGGGKPREPVLVGVWVGAFHEPALRRDRWNGGSRTGHYRRRVYPGKQVMMRKNEQHSIIVDTDRAGRVAFAPGRGGGNPLSPRLLNPRVATYSAEILSSR